MHNMQFFKPALNPLGTKLTVLFWVSTRRVVVINSSEERSSQLFNGRSMKSRLGAMFSLMCP